MKRILCIWLPSWPLQRLVADRPDLKGRVIILHARDSRRGGCVVVCSRAAHQLGIRPGMPLAEAMMLQRPDFHRAASTSDCSGPIYPGPIYPGPVDRGLTYSDGKYRKPEASYIARYSPESDWRAIEQLAIACEAFSPTVGFEHTRCLTKASDCQPSPSSLDLDVTNLGAHFGNDSQLAHRVAQWMHQQGYHVRIGLADTLGAAWAAAHFGSRWAALVTPDISPSCEASAGATAPDRSTSTSKLLRCSYWVITMGTTLSALNPLPIEALRLPSSTVASLQQLGLFHIRQLAQLPRAQIASRFGPVLWKRWDQTIGLQGELIEPYRSAAALQTSIVLEHPTTHRMAIQTALEQLVQELSTLLVAQGKAAVALICQFQSASSNAVALQATVSTEAGTARTRPIAPTCQVGNFDDSNTPQVLTFRISLFRPTVSSDHLMDLVRMRMESIRLSGPVQHMAIKVTETALLETRQQSLLPDTCFSEPQLLPRLVDRLRSRLGCDRVVTAQLQADAQPELAYRYVDHATSHTVRRDHDRTAAAASNRSPQIRIRPLYLYSSPIPLAVVAISPDGPPIHLKWKDQHHRVMHHSGPERIETGWWRGRSVRRDYYRVEVDTGARFWLYRQLDNSKWFLHGEFG